MCDLQSGKYIISLAGTWGPPSFAVGANHQDESTTPVTAAGTDSIWTIHRHEDGKYALVLEETGTPWFCKVGGEDVVVSTEPPPAGWVIRKHDNGYTIQVPSHYWPTKAWASHSSKPGTKVKLETLEVPVSGQLWKITHIHRV